MRLSMLEPSVVRSRNYRLGAADDDVVLEGDGRLDGARPLQPLYAPLQVRRGRRRDRRPANLDLDAFSVDLVGPLKRISTGFAGYICC